MEFSNETINEAADRYRLEIRETSSSVSTEIEAKKGFVAGVNWYRDELLKQEKSVQADALRKSINDNFNELLTYPARSCYDDIVDAILTDIKSLKEISDIEDEIVQIRFTK